MNILETGTMTLSIRSTIKEGDRLETVVNWNKTKRTVIYEKGGVRIGEYWFTWESFFEVNTPIKITN